LAGAVLVLLTVVLIPLQAMAVARNWAIQRRIPQFYHRIACYMMGLRISIVGTPPRQRSSLIVSNHSSWIDISVISAAAPVAFVAKHEIAQWPVFGLLARLQRSIFVDRRRRCETKKVNEKIADRLAGGDPVVLFAEGTSSDGNHVLPFRSALIGAAGDALIRAGATSQILLQPLSIAYVGLHGLPMGRRNRFRAAWCGTTDLLPHLGRILREGGIDVVLTWGEPIPYTRHSDRKEITRTLETTVRRLTSNALRTTPRFLPFPIWQPPAPVRDIDAAAARRFSWFPKTTG
jgi:1-acyl-sn-glycerol-3-phosphate acyltransferase